jgi:stress response protein YsnF
MTLSDLRGKPVYDMNHNKIGTLDELYVDEDDNKPSWATVKTGLFGGKANFVPLAKAHPTEEGLEVAATKDEVAEAPKVAVGEELSEEDETRLYRYYREIYHNHTVEAEANAQDDQDTDAPSADSESNRSDEESSRDEKQPETRKVHLRKYVVTENVNITVPVQREEVRLVQEPINDDNADHDQNDRQVVADDREVTLYEEVPIVTKKVVPKEKVRLDKDTVQHEQLGDNQKQEPTNQSDADKDDDRR